ncbi:MAG: excinuclease ABC subunit UvrC [Candidatus Saganbacteria bacterium]|nr:excinuclease ABC subunit UvrC [Candidatus Saganbacteria bacterium]
MGSLKEKLKSLPKKPGVYLFKDKYATILYVGKAKSLFTRVSSYFTPSPDLKTGILLARLHDIDYIVVKSEMEALLLEDELIKKYKPRYNISLRDDKSYPYLKLTVNEKWPRLLLVRRKVGDGALYFGRYQGKMVREVIRLCKKLFPIRWCKESPLQERKQGCLYYRIGTCSGPCIGKIAKKDYWVLVQGIKALLSGKMDQALAKLKQEMVKNSSKREYERAAYLRDRMKILSEMLEGKELSAPPTPRRLSEIIELKKVLKLKKEPMRIEAFDVSNISSKNIVGSMVVFYGGLPAKSEYRKFKVRTLKNKPNDVAAIYEIVRRRYSKSLASQLSLPDLVLVDGGVAQANAGKKALVEANLASIPIIGLAKKQEIICFPNVTKTLALAKTSSALKLLQRIRDEAHRFAITYHRQKRARSLYES